MRSCGFVTTLLAFLALGSAPGEASEWPSPTHLGRALQSLPVGSTLVAFHPLAHNHVQLSRKVAARAQDLPAKLTNAAFYKAALPSFAEVEVVESRVRPHLGNPVVDRRVQWELEVPLWNLEGELWFKPFGNEVQVRFSRDAFAPGAFSWRWQPVENDALVLVLSGTANTRDANWGTRKIAARSPLAEPAMTAAAAFAALEALGHQLTSTTHAFRLPRWPTAPMQPPSVHELEPSLLDIARSLQHPGPLALVNRRRDGRLHHVQVALWSPLDAEAARGALEKPLHWQALPGWKRITLANGGAHWEVDASFPFLDFDAVWSVETRAADLRATAIDGAARGAIWSWRVESAAAQAPGRSLLVFGYHPRLDRLGFVPRKFLEKEPLLEGGLALALAYVNAVSLVRALPAPAR